MATAKTVGSFCIEETRPSLLLARWRKAEETAGAAVNVTSEVFFFFPGKMEEMQWTRWHLEMLSWWKKCKADLVSTVSSVCQSLVLPPSAVRLGSSRLQVLKTCLWVLSRRHSAFAHHHTHTFKNAPCQKTLRNALCVLFILCSCPRAVAIMGCLKVHVAPRMARRHLSATLSPGSGQTRRLETIQFPGESKRGLWIVVSSTGLLDISVAAGLQTHDTRRPNKPPPHWYAVITSEGEVVVASSWKKKKKWRDCSLWRCSSGVCTLTFEPWQPTAVTVAAADVHSSTAWAFCTAVGFWLTGIKCFLSGASPGSNKHKSC